ncbi:hypothetical protein EST38_g9791 [Candolleomyces aberdarensis]|uniref:DUF6534 domain-containing protein n=1 Tax=Candolleomyces aberdarensis TaxID=2316362 RepID=A0A4Q2DB89_9AGAR|nr:hypothetical protein EST38_g9791 [Candolleomyces aberdarensis]
MLRWSHYPPFSFTQLLKFKGSTVYRRTKEVIDVVVSCTLENGSATMLFSIPYIILYVKYPTTFLAVAAEFILGRLYANVLLVTLNCRDLNTQELEFKDGVQEDFIAANAVQDSGSQTFDRQLEFIVEASETGSTDSSDDSRRSVV